MPEDEHPYQVGDLWCQAPPADPLPQCTLYGPDGKPYPFGESSQPPRTPSPPRRVSSSEKLITVPGDQARDVVPLTQPDPRVERRQGVRTGKSSKNTKQGSTTTRRADQDPEVQTLHSSADEEGIPDGSQVSSGRQTLDQKLRTFYKNGGTLNRGQILFEGPGRGRPGNGDIRFDQLTPHEAAKQEAKRSFGT